MTTTVEYFDDGRIEITKLDNNRFIVRKYRFSHLINESYYLGSLTNLHRDENDLPASIIYNNNGEIQAKYWYINGEQKRRGGGPVYERFY